MDSYTMKEAKQAEYILATCELGMYRKAFAMLQLQKNTPDKELLMCEIDSKISNLERQLAIIERDWKDYITQDVRDAAKKYSARFNSKEQKEKYCE